MKLTDFLAALETVAPAALAMAGDNGLLVGPDRRGRGRARRARLHARHGG